MLDALGINLGCALAASQAHLEIHAHVVSGGIVRTVGEGLHY